jgi:hypothetical protein
VVGVVVVASVVVLGEAAVALVVGVAVALVVVVGVAVALVVAFVVSEVLLKVVGVMLVLSLLEYAEFKGSCNFVKTPHLVEKFYKFHEMHVSCLSLICNPKFY